MQSAGFVNARKIDGCAVLMLVLCSCCAHAPTDAVLMRVLCSWCDHVVIMPTIVLCSCCAHAVLMLCSCCAHAVLMLMLCSCCAVTGSHLLHRRQVHRSSPGGQIGFIQHILMRRLVVIHEVAVGHICKVLTVAMLAVLWCYHTICDEVRQE